MSLLIGYTGLICRLGDEGEWPRGETWCAGSRDLQAVSLRGFWRVQGHGLVGIDASMGGSQGWDDLINKIKSLT